MQVFYEAKLLFEDKVMLQIFKAYLMQVLYSMQVFYEAKLLFD